MWTSLGGITQLTTVHFSGVGEQRGVETTVLSSLYLRILVIDLLQSHPVPDVPMTIVKKRTNENFLCLTNLPRKRCDTL